MKKIEEIITQSDYILTFGSFLAQDNVAIQEAIIQAIAKNNAEFIYTHPIDNVDLKVYYSQFIKYEVGSEEGIASMLLDTFVKESNEAVQAYIDDLDIGYISGESSAGEEELEEALEKAQGKTKKTLIVGRDVFTHERVENITKILSVINKYSDLEVVCLDESSQNEIDSCMCEDLEEVEELDSYNGTVVYRIYGEENTDLLIGSQSFARVAKVADKDEVYINCAGEKIKKSFIVDTNLQGTVALCAVSNNDTSGLSAGYRYKQVKIEKVDDNG